MGHDKKAEAALTVSGMLGRWLTSLCGEERGRRALLWNTMRGSMPAVYATFTLMVMVLTAVGVEGRARGSQGIVASLIDLVYAVSLLGCAISQHFFAKKGKEARELLRRLRAVALQLEELEQLDPDTREEVELSLAARTARRWFLGMRLYASMAGLSVTLPHFYTLKPVPAIWPSTPELEAPLALAFAAISLLNCIGYSEFLGLLLCCNSTSIGMYRALGVRLRRAGGNDDALKQVTRLHGELNSTATLLEALFAPYLPWFLTPSLGGTALATCGFLYGSFSPNFMSLVPQIFIIFIPLCMSGDALQCVSGDGFADNAYNAGWLEWSTPARRFALCIMTRCKRPQALSVKAFGHADRSACLSVLKTWFSVLQTLINLSGF